MQIKSNYDLSAHNTLRLKSTAQYFVELLDTEQLPSIFEFIAANNIPFLVLGGGSNLILPLHYNGLVIHNCLLGVGVVAADAGSEAILVRAMAGVVWDDFIAETIQSGWFGLENLSLIPGTVGASPIQNIGAYGVEAKDFIECVEVYDTESGVFSTLSNSECGFSYRDSCFKHDNHYIVISVTFRLRLTSQLNISYGDIAKQMENIASPTAADLRNCIIKTRQSKLPDPKIIGNVGSFFHNPILANSEIKVLQEKYANIPVYKIDETKSKVSAGWLIDNLGLKGFCLGNVGVYDKQALVLVNHAHADQAEILDFAGLIQDKVFTTYEVKLNIEPIIVE